MCGTIGQKCILHIRNELILLQEMLSDSTQATKEKANKIHSVSGAANIVGSSSAM